MSSSYYGSLARKQVNSLATNGKGQRSAQKRATYYLWPDQIKTIKLRAALEDKTISEIVRTALDLYLSPGPAKTRRPQIPEEDILFCSPD